MTSRLFHLAVIVIALAPSLILAAPFPQAFGRAESPQRPFTDAWTYLRPVTA